MTKQAMTPTEHIRAAERILSDLSFYQSGSPAVRSDGKFYPVDTDQYRVIFKPEALIPNDDRP